MKNKKAELAWQRITSDENFNLKVQKIRKNFNIPFIDGHTREFHYVHQAIDTNIEDIVLDLPSDEKLGDRDQYHCPNEKWGRVNRFENEVDKLADYCHKVGGLGEFGLKKLDYHYSDFGTRVLSEAVGKYILYNTTDVEYLENINTTSCYFFPVTDENSKIERKLSLGIYLKIAPTSSKSDIKLAFDLYEEKIELWRHFLANRSNVVIKTTKNKLSKKTKRDQRIFELKKLKKEELITLAKTTSRSKDLLISIIMEKEGLPASVDTVRKICSRKSMTNKK